MAIIIHQPSSAIMNHSPSLTIMIQLKHLNDGEMMVNRPQDPTLHHPPTRLGPCHLLQICQLTSTTTSSYPSDVLSCSPTFWGLNLAHPSPTLHQPVTKPSHSTHRPRPPLDVPARGFDQKPRFRLWQHQLATWEPTCHGRVVGKRRMVETKVS